MVGGDQYGKSRIPVVVIVVVRNMERCLEVINKL